MVNNMETMNIQEIARNNFKQRNDWLGRKWLGERVPVTCFLTAIKKASEAHRIALQYVPTKAHPFPPRPGRCAHRLRIQFGIPCWCEILKNILPTDEGEEDNKGEIKPLTKLDFHPKWHLERSLVMDGPDLPIEAPAIVDTQRGRPKNGPVTHSHLPRPWMTDDVAHSH
ncbi:hypothetical protein F4804DRAFT_150087 [Jackrogersella minutella]|nr:hypothetical protein F4804DRAFT_150087 [Jackrogersella minutella]